MEISEIMHTFDFRKTDKNDQTLINFFIMIRLNVFFEVNAGVTAEQVKAATAAMVTDSRTHEGNISYDLFASTSRDNVYMFCETWRDQAALDAHGQTESFKTGCGNLQKLMKGEWKLERFEFKK